MHTPTPHMYKNEIKSEDHYYFVIHECYIKFKCKKCISEVAVVYRCFSSAVEEICSSSRDQIIHEKDLGAVFILNLQACHVLACFLVTTELPQIIVLHQNSL